jgi:effector-binding domain-containing protein
MVFLLSEKTPSIQVKEKPSFTYVYMSFTGSFKTMPQKIMEFMGEFFKQGLKPGGELISVYHNSPEDVKESELKWDVGFPVSEKTIVKAPLKNGTYEKKTVLEYKHKGSYDLLPEIYKKLTVSIKEKNLTIVLPTYEFYLNSPMEVKAEELLTRIEIPVKKK